MSVHRFRELWNSPEPEPTAIALGAFAAFIPCPVMYGMSMVQQAQVEYLYRLAYEQAQVQAVRAQPSRWPAFSVN